MTVRVGIIMALLACAGCSSSSASGTASPGPDGGKALDGGDAGDAGGDVGPGEGGGGTDCLASAPHDGSMCGPQGLVCEYGTATVQACDTLASCNGGRWQITTPGPGGLQCMSGPASECPATLGTVPVGQHCTPLALVCDYPDGRCACDVRTGAPVTDASAQATWICPSPDPSCPMPRPRLGAACSHAGLECDYGTCAIPGATAETCTGGIWVQAMTKCGG